MHRLRTLVVALRLLPLTLSFVRDHRRWIVRGGPVARTGAFHEARAARLVRTIARLGPAFVKMAQIVGARADLVPEPYLGALGTLHDQVPPIPRAAVARAVREAYGQEADALFERFEWAPLAAASLGQVHRARWEGEDVVVKVLRPGVEDVVAADLRAAGAIMDAVERRWPHPHLRGLRNVLREFAARVGDEMDFRREAANAEAMLANFAGRPGVKIPRVVPSLVRRQTFVMEYVPGERIDRLQARVAAGTLDPMRLVQRVVELYMHMMLVDGFFHADPHPGNLLVQDDGTIVVLDFGMVVPVERTLRRQLARTAFAGIQRDPEGLIEGFLALGVLEAHADRAVARELVEALLEIANAADTTSMDRIQLVADRVMRTLFDFPVNLPANLVYFARTAALIEGLGTRYDARFNAITFAAPVALRMRGAIMASLRDPSDPDDAALGIDWARLVGSAAGQAAAAVVRAGRELGRELVGIFGRLAAEWQLAAPAPRPEAHPDARADGEIPAAGQVLPAHAPRAITAGDGASGAARPGGAGELAAD